MSTPHDGGIVGLVQMQPGNWALFAPPGGNPFDQHDALSAAAKFLCAHGAASDIRGALFAYNHLDSYVADVLNWAQVYSAWLSPALGTDTNGASTTGSSTAVAVFGSHMRPRVHQPRIRSKMHRYLYATAPARV